MAATLTPGPDTKDRLLRESLKGSMRALRAAAVAPGLPVRPGPEPATDGRVRSIPDTDALSIDDVVIDLRVGGAPVAAPPSVPSEPPRPTSTSAAFQYVAVRSVGTMYCYQCGNFSVHQLVRLTSSRSRLRHRTGGYLRQCMSCGVMASPAADDLVAAGIPPNQWHPARGRLTIFGIAATMASSLAIVVAAGVAIGAALT